MFKYIYLISIYIEKEKKTLIQYYQTKTIIYLLITI